MKAHEWVSEQTASTMTDWQARVKEIAESSSPTGCVALVGMGHPLRSDDYSGSFIVKKIIAHTNDRRLNTIRLFDGEDNVENLITKIAALEPHHVIFIDACEMKAPPGTTQLIHVSQTSFPFFTTHGIPLKLLAQRIFTKSNVWVLAIQPKSTDFGEELSVELRAVADSISGFLVELLRERGS